MAKLKVANSRIYLFEFDEETNRIFCAGFRETELHVVQVTWGDKVMSVLKKDVTMKKSSSMRCGKDARVIKIWKERNELYIGHSEGFLSVFSLNPRVMTSICSFG